MRVLGASALDMLAGTLSASAGGWSPLDRRGNSTGMIVYRLGPWKVDPRIARRWYVRKYAQLDPFRHMLGQHPEVSVVSIGDLGGYELFSRSAFAQEYLRGIGFPFRITLNLHVSGRPVARAWLGRTLEEGDFDLRESSMARKTHGFIQTALAQVSLLTSAGSGNGHPSTLDGYGLTSREKDVAVLAATGATNAEVARELSISVATVKSHLYKAYAKLNIRTRVELSHLLVRSMV
ncbi:MAG: response regulator transcription factor [Actinomycetota bacterium]